MASSPSPHSRSAIRSQEGSPRSQSLQPSANSTAPSFVPAWRRPTLVPDGADGDRRPSVQFVPQLKAGAPDSAGTSRSSSVQPTSSRPKLGSLVDGGRRLSSPPPPAQFRSSVSFDTFSNPAASDFSLSLNRKHRDYEYTKRSRTFLCGTDTNDYSDTALEWLIDELVDDGDEVVCLRVVEKDSKEAVKWAGGQGEKGYRREAHKFLDAIEKKNTEGRAISLVLEFSVGKVHDTIQQMIRIYEPAILVVGTKGRALTGYQGLLSSGSVSKYCLQYSPVPVIVVRPSSKREAKKRKRLKDPSRTSYRDILDKSEDAPRGRGGHLLDAQNRTSLVGSDLGALGQWDSAADPDHEARMVAEAIGYKGDRGLPRSSLGEGRGNSLSRVTSLRSEGSESDVRSPDERLLQSPDLRNVDSPPPSDDEDADSDDDDFSRLGETVVRPEDEALMLAYERAQIAAEEEKEEAEARAKQEQERRERSASRGRVTGRRPASRGGRDEDAHGGAAALGLLAQLDRGIK